jgi:hypothetical protein
LRLRFHFHNRLWRGFNFCFGLSQFGLVSTASSGSAFGAATGSSTGSVSGSAAFFAFFGSAFFFG